MNDFLKPIITDEQGDWYTMIAIAELAQRTPERIRQWTVMDNPKDFSDMVRAALKHDLKTAQKLHYKLMEINSSKSISSRAGSSALFSVLKDKVLSIVSVGNCSAYLVRSCGVYQLVLEDNLRLLCRNQEPQLSLP